MTLIEQIIFDEVAAERGRQNRKWGEQNHSPLEWLAVLGEEYGEVSQEVLRSHFGGKPLTDYRQELIQVAAVAIAAIDCLDRIKRAETAP